MARWKPIQDMADSGLVLAASPKAREPTALPLRTVTGVCGVIPETLQHTA